MTPPDSGETICGPCRDGNHDGCVIGLYGHVTPDPECTCPCPVKPDSGEREVTRCEVCGRKHDSRLHKIQDDGRRWSYSCFAKVHARCAGGSCACDCHVGVFVQHDLAQRLLALVEDVGDMALASELRAIVERKT